MNRGRSIPPWIAVWSILLFVIAFALLIPKNSEAAGIGNPMWFKKDNSGNVVGQVELEKVNSRGSSERASFSCINPDTGRALSPVQKDALQAIIMEGGWAIFAGNFSPEEQLGGIGGDVDAGDFSEKPNWGFPKGTEGFRLWLRNESNFLKKRSAGNKDSRGELRNGQRSAWTPLGERRLDIERREDGNGVWGTEGTYFWSANGGDRLFMDPDQDEKWKEDNADWESAYPLTADQGGEIGNMIANRVIRASNPLEAAQLVPGGCIGIKTATSDVELSDFFGGGITDIFLKLGLNMAGGIVGAVYELFVPSSLTNAFWNPHSERGDTMWNIGDCSTSGSDSCTQSSSAIKGFSDKTGYERDRAPWLKMAYFMQWLISGAYFIVLFAAALIYMVRGNRDTSLQLMRLIPRLLLSILFTVTTVFTIGAVISFSNLLAKSIIDTGDGFSVSGINAILASAGYLISMDSSSGGSWGVGVLDGDIFQQLINFFVLLSATGAGILLWILAAIRQIVLILLIVLAPIAGFSLIVERWRHHFFGWCCRLGWLAATPVLLALVLKIALMMGWGLSGGGGVESLTGFKGFLFTMFILIAYWAMAYVAFFCIKMSIFCKQRSFIRGAAGGAEKAGSLAKFLPIPGAAAVGMGLQAGGGALKGYGGGMAGKMGALVPGGRESSTGGAMMQAGGGAAKPAGLLSSVGAAKEAALQAHEGEKIREFQARRAQRELAKMNEEEKSLAGGNTNVTGGQPVGSGAGAGAAPAQNVHRRVGDKINEEKMEQSGYKDTNQGDTERRNREAAQTQGKVTTVRPKEKNTPNASPGSSGVAKDALAEGGAPTAGSSGTTNSGNQKRVGNHSSGTTNSGNQKRVENHSSGGSNKAEERRQARIIREKGKTQVRAPAPKPEPKAKP